MRDYDIMNRISLTSLEQPLFDWLSTLYPVWARLDEEAAYVSAWIGLAELALGGCTTTADHLYVHPRPKLIDAEIAAAREVGLRFHPTRGSMSLSQKDGGLPPDAVVQDEEEILADSERLIASYHDPNPGSMLRIGLAPCSPFSVSPQLMRAPPSWLSGTTSVSTPTWPKIPTRIASALSASGGARSSTSRRSVGPARGLGSPTASIQTRTRSVAWAPAVRTSPTARARTC